MNIYKIKNPRPLDYDMYESAVVVAENERDARLFHPAYGWNKTFSVISAITGDMTEKHWYDIKDKYRDEWCSPHQLEVELIGIADPKYTEPTIIETSFTGG